MELVAENKKHLPYRRWKTGYPVHTRLYTEPTSSPPLPGKYISATMQSALHYNLLIINLAACHILYTHTHRVINNLITFMQNSYSPKQSTVYLLIWNALLNVWAWNLTSVRADNRTSYRHLEKTSELHSNKVLLDLHSNEKLGWAIYLLQTKSRIRTGHNTWNNCSWYKALRSYS